MGRDAVHLPGIGYRGSESLPGRRLSPSNRYCLCKISNYALHRDLPSCTGCCKLVDFNGFLIPNWEKEGIENLGGEGNKFVEMEG